jgi:hypothetical protein
MAYSVKKIEVWTGDISDRAGGLASKLAALAEAKADLTFVVARRQPNQPGMGVVFLGPIKGGKQSEAARAGGLSPAQNLAALQVEGTNKPGECYQIAKLIADEHINLRGLSAESIGNKFAVTIAFDNEQDADKAAKVLRSGGGKK